MRDAIGPLLARLGHERPDFFVVDADNGPATRIRSFGNTHPSRYVNVGIAEQNLAGVSAGLTLAGAPVIAATFSVFLLGRAYDQIRNTIAASHLPVILLGTHAGLSTGADGGSHCCPEDLALMRALPDMQVLIPACNDDLEAMFNFALDSIGPSYIRVPRNDLWTSPPKNIPSLHLKAASLRCWKPGKELAFVSAGLMLPRVIKVANELSNSGISAAVYDTPFLNLDEVSTVAALRQFDSVITVEDHWPAGGIGEMITSMLVSDTSNTKLRTITAAHRFPSSGKIEEALDYVKKTAGEDDVVCFVSGGLDSSVTASLLLAAELPGKIKFVLIDTGLLREGEVEQITSTYRKMGIEVEVRKEAEHFYDAQTVLRDGRQSNPLSEATEPQEIRQIIGDAFISVRKHYLAEIGWDKENTMLAMGTLRPDLIESGSALASVNADEEGIKIHHNDSDDARRLRDNGQLIEPLTELHKDEVRALAVALGLPNEIVFRQASPGPSGGVQIMAQVDPYRHEDIDRINEQLSSYRAAKVGAAILQMATVGVQGDRRSYSHVVALSTDGLPSSWRELSSLANEIPRTISGVNRVVHASGEIVNGIVEGFTPTLIDNDGIQLWRTVDHKARRILAKFGLDNASIISEVPIILTPVSYGVDGGRAVAIRPFITEDYMTGEAAIPGINFPMEAYIEMLAEVTAIKGVSRLLYDLTDKPPGPTQWR